MDLRRKKDCGYSKSKDGRSFKVATVLPIRPNKKKTFRYGYDSNSFGSSYWPPAAVRFG